MKQHQRKLQHLSLAILGLAAILYSTGCATSHRPLLTMVDTAVETVKNPATLNRPFQRIDVPETPEQAQELRLKTEVYMIKASRAGNQRERERYLKLARECVINLSWVEPDDPEVADINRRLAKLETDLLAQKSEALSKTP